MPQTNQIDQTLQINSSELPQSRKDNRNILILILIIFIVGLLGILIGLLAFLLNSRNNNQTVTTNSNSSSTTQNLSTTSLTNSVTTITSSNTTATSNLNNSTSVSNSTTSSSVSFSHNEGKYIRFDYPTGWKVDVQSNRQDNIFTSFNDIMQVSIEKPNIIQIQLNFQGGFGCDGNPNQFLIDFTSPNELILKQYDHSTLQTNIFKYNIVEFNKIKLNLKTSQSIYLVSVKLDNYNNLPESWNNGFLGFMYLKDNNLRPIECDLLSLEEINYTQLGTTLTYGFYDKNAISLADLSTIIERLTNSFEKK